MLVRIFAEILGLCIIIPSAGYGIYVLILRALNRPKVIVVTKPSDNQSS